MRARVREKNGAKMAAKSKKDIRESLMQQLISKGADVAYFEALIDDYVEYFGLVKKMKADIRKNGLSSALNRKKHLLMMATTIKME